MDNLNQEKVTTAKLDNMPMVAKEHNSEPITFIDALNSLSKTVSNVLNIKGE